LDPYGQYNGLLGRNYRSVIDIDVSLMGVESDSGSADIWVQLSCMTVLNAKVVPRLHSKLADSSFVFNSCDTTLM